eukprot:Rhum_TRINITY_DN14617_c0_g1::Rhum_TRINITY_DN14617_c0_g1_i1::g.105108::m.105108/K05643/ABCA3; ATP-binding cassette, subfamily A (ABC1), member 3
MGKGRGGALPSPTATPSPTGSATAHKHFHVEGAKVDLSSYELKHRKLSHFSIAVHKTLRLKTRKLKGFLCEMLLPPIMICALMIGYYLSTNTRYGDASYDEEPFLNVTDYAKDAFCTVGSTPAQKAASPWLQECTGATTDCGSNVELWPSNVTGNGQFVCGVATEAGVKAGRDLFSKLNTMDIGLAVPRFDDMVAVYGIVNYFAGDLDVNTDSAANSLKRRGNLEFVGKCEDATALQAYMRANTQFFDLVLNTTVNRGNPSCPHVWANEDAAVDYVKDENGGAANTWAVIILNEVNAATNVYDYTMRMNYTATPYTFKKEDKFANGLGKNRARQYAYAGFTTLERIIDSHFLKEQDYKAAATQDEYVFVPMPTKGYLDSGFYAAAGSQVPLVLMLAFLYSISCLVGGVVEEKEHRLREGMLIMGLSKGSFYASWFCSYAAIFTVSALLMTFFTAITYFSNTSAFLLFVLFELFAFSLIGVSLLLTVFFSKSRIAATVAPLIAFGMAIPKFNIPEDASLGTKSMASLSSSVAFGYCVDLVVNYEKQGSGSNFSDFTADEYSFALGMFMMIFDTFLYLILALYLDNVLPSQYGVKLHPLFFLYPSYWGFSKTGKYGNTHVHNVTPPSRPPHYVDTEIDESTRQELAAREAVRIEGLRIEFESATKDGEKNVAVNNLGNGVPKGAAGGEDALTFYEGQVQCVLGHNGAGKTTLINMMTGMLSPVSGDCKIWGESILSHMDIIRQSIGFCPQHNILWGTLSCEEHLMFYGRIKGVPTEVLKARTTQMLKLVNLYEKKDCWSEVLSGGQKRKLSVACSLIGGSKLVFLDEPTAGMDVESRRAMWHLLRHPSVLQGRVIVLTTHYMEEADILGDSVAIMHKGCLHSWGSPFFLKSRMGAGYNISLAMQKGCNPRRVLDFVQLRMKRVTVEQLSCTGTELVLRVPMDAEPTAESVRLASQTLGIQYDGNPSVFKAAVTRVAESSPSDKKQAACQSVLASMRSMAGFPAMLDELDAASAELRIEGYGVGMTTLEEIFMRIESECDEQELLPSPTGSETSLMDHTPLLPEGDKAVDIAGRFGDLYTITDANQPPKSGSTLTTDQFRGMLLKRFRCARRDKRALCFQFVLPVLFLLLALLIGSISPAKNPLLPLTGNVYKDDRDSVLTYSATPSKEALFTANNFPGYVLRNVTDATQGSYVGLSDYLDATLETRWKGDIRGVAIAYTEDTPVVLSNMTYFHSMPAGIAGYLNALLQDKQTKEGKKGGSVTVNSHTLPLSFRGKTIDNARMRAISSLFISMPFALLPSTFVSFIVKERECKAKHVQMVSGAKRSAYWFSSFVFDFVAYLVTMTLAFLIFFAAGRDSLVGDGHTFSATFMLFTSYGLSSILSGYVISFLFKSHVAAQNATMLLNLAGSVVLVLIVQILHYTTETESFADTLTFFCRLVPTYALTDGLTQLSLREMYTTTNALDYTMGPWDLKIAGWDIIFMLLTCPFFAAWIAYLESPEMRARVRSALPFLNKHGETLNNSFTDVRSDDDFDPEMYGKHDTDGPSVLFRRGPWLMCRDDAGETYYFNEVTGKSKTSSRETPFYKDPAVQRHAAEVLENPEGRPGDYVTVQRLRKVFPAQGGAAKKVAVCDVSFGVGSGELFAFLGTNGAGKSTTLSMLSSEYEPTSGRAMLAGHDVVLETGLARQHLGFCPQFDALLDNLTCQEHLDLFACLRGVPDEHRAGSADILLTGLGLDAHRNKLAGTLSGGNRRKLQVAAALIGGPSAIFLDEPSAGMDPLARRSLWGALEKAITELKLSVILTTHHLEEIEGLSRLDHRVTIMVDGRLQCLGSLSQLKNQLGDSYELTLKVNSLEAEGRLKEFIQKTWSTADLLESVQQRLSYQVSKEEVSLSSMFRLIEDNRSHLGISDYSIGETSLEQLFLRISERAMRDEDKEAYSSNADEIRVFAPAPPSTLRDSLAHVDVSLAE